MDDYNESGIPEWDKEFEEFWKSLLQKEGIFDENLIKNEMHDLVFIYKQVAEVYCHITGGQLSKPMYYASVIKSIYDEKISNDQDILDLVPELIKALKNSDKALAKYVNQRAYHKEEFLELIKANHEIITKASEIMGNEDEKPKC